MPVASNPHEKDFYVYEFTHEDRPYYVGVGRSKRCSDRERFLRTFAARYPEKLKHKTLKDRVMVKLIEQSGGLNYRYAATELTKAEAHTFERVHIKRLIEQGYLLVNEHHNPHWR